MTVRQQAYSSQHDYERLHEFVESNTPLFVLTGAGCSTDSGIPDYRDHNGRWKNRKPVLFSEFICNESVRKRYWARSMAGWPRIYHASPNQAHVSLAEMESSGAIHYLVTQNVDGLHQKAGSRRVLDLHGNLANVICVDCHKSIPRIDLQEIFRQSNPGRDNVYHSAAPDGDVILNDIDYDSFNIPVCDSCGGILKPDVVFFGETVPKERVNQALSRLKESNGLCVIGSSLMVYSGFRFVREAVNTEIPVAVINIGKTRADLLLALKFQSPCGPLLRDLARLMNSGSINKALIE